MKETQQQPVAVQALRGVNQTPSERLDEFATLQNVAPDQIGRHSRILGKRTVEKVAGPVMAIHQFWTAYGYGNRLRQTSGGVILDPEPPDDPGFKQPIYDEPLNCRPVKPYSNKLTLQYLDPLTDYVNLLYHWTKCDGTDFDSRTSLRECSIAGIPTFDGTVKQAAVGYFHDGPVLEFWHGGQNIIALAADQSYPYESVVINLYALRQLAGAANFTAKFRLQGYFFSYINQGNVLVNFEPKERTVREGTYGRIFNGGLTYFSFPRCTKYNPKSWKAHIVTQSSTPSLSTGDHICYLHVKFFPSQPNKDRIWIDDV